MTTSEMTECSICRKALDPAQGGSMNGITFCTNTDCIEKAIKRALEPVVAAMEKAKG